MTLSPISKFDRSAEPELRRMLDGKAKPLGALGRLEDLAVQLALIEGVGNPTADHATLFVFAGDHGLNEDGVSPYPSAVTAAMVATLTAGKASANAFARCVGADVLVVDAGVAADLPASPSLVDRKVRRGSRNAAREPALTAQELDLALSHGFALAAEANADVVLLGEMGIGNSASAALITHALTGAPLVDCIGPGAGHDGEGLQKKRDVLVRAAARAGDVDGAYQVLLEYGGLEIAMMAGAVLGAAATRKPVVIDGFICTAAALAAVKLQPNALDACIFAHRSKEPGHRAALAEMKAEPLLDLQLRLGEGTGALLALPLLRAACALVNEVATLDQVLSGDLG